MGIATGMVVEGKVLVEGMTLPEGTVVTIVTPDVLQGVTVSPEDEALLLESLAQAERGETITVDELFQRLDRHATS